LSSEGQLGVIFLILVVGFCAPKRRSFEAKNEVAAELQEMKTREKNRRARGIAPRYNRGAKPQSGEGKRGGSLRSVSELSTDCKNRREREFCERGGITMQEQKARLARKQFAEWRKLWNPASLAIQRK